MSSSSGYAYRGTRLAPWTAANWIERKLGRRLMSGEMQVVQIWCAQGPSVLRKKREQGELARGTRKAMALMAEFEMSLKPVITDVTGRAA